MTWDEVKVGDVLEIDYLAHGAFDHWIVEKIGGVVNGCYLGIAEGGRVYLARPHAAIFGIPMQGGAMVGVERTEISPALHDWPFRKVGEAYYPIGSTDCR